jgi:hypothetical protein
MNNSNFSSAPLLLSDDLHLDNLMGEPAFRVDARTFRLPFLMQLITSCDLWAFIGSQGAITAGRKNPDHALFPYYTQDKLFDMAHVSGSCTILRVPAADTSTPPHSMAAIYR